MLDKSTRVQMGNNGKHPDLNLLGGSMRLDIPANGRIRVFALGRMIIPTAPFEGIISLEGTDKIQVITIRGSVHVKETGVPVAARGLFKGQVLGRRAAMVVITVAATAPAVMAVERQRSPARSPSQP